MREKKITEAMMECYQLLYEKSTPSADFKQLMDNAELNERGEKVIDFNSYEIEEDKFDEIIQGIVFKYKFKNYIEKSFKVAITLGCSPKFKRNW